MPPRPPVTETEKLVTWMLAGMQNCLMMVSGGVFWMPPVLLFLMGSVLGVRSPGHFTLFICVALVVVRLVR